MPSPPEASSSSRPLKPAYDGQSSKTPAARKSKTANARISAACEACKKRKTKCTGGPSPCQLCETLGTECVIDLSLDMRRRAAFQRTIDESKTYQDALNSLLDRIRDGSSTTLEPLFEYIRNGATNQEATLAIQQHLSHASQEDDNDTLTSQMEGIESFNETSVSDRSPTAISGRRSSTSDTKPARDIEVKHLSVSSLLASLKNSSPAQAEAILRRFMTQRMDEKFALPLWTPDEIGQSDGSGHGQHAPSVSDREQWHPVLHLRDYRHRQQVGLLADSHDVRKIDQPQMPPVRSPTSISSPVGTTGPPSRMRIPQSSSSSPDDARGQPQHPSINTDVQVGNFMVASSPATPYFEAINSFPSEQAKPNAFDLCIAQQDQISRLRIPRYLVLPLIIPDDSPMSRTYTDYLFGARRMLDSGVPASYVLGATDRVPVDLFFRERQANDRFDCASWACEVSRSYDTDLAVRLATACLLTYMMRWLLVPTPERWQQMPTMMRPTPTQCMIAHIGAIETIPFPCVRDAAITKLRDWLTPLIEAEWSVNWPHTIDAAVERESVTGATVLTRRFVQHAFAYENWSVTASFLNSFPEAAGRLRTQ